MLAAGIDLAASPANTAIALLRDATVVDLVMGATDDDIVAATGAAADSGVRAP